MAMETAAKSNEDKCKLLQATFFHELERDDTSHTDVVYPALKFKFHWMTNEQIRRAIARLGPFKAPRPDGIPNIMLIRCTDLLIPHLGPLYQVTFKLNVYPASWRDSVMIMLRKPRQSQLHSAKHTPAGHSPQHHSEGIVSMCSRRSHPHG